MTTSMMTTFQDMQHYLHWQANEICGKEKVDVDKIIGHFRKISIHGDPKRIEMKDLMEKYPVTSALSYIFAASMHRRVAEPKLEDARYCFYMIYKAIQKFQKNDAATDRVTDTLIKLMIEMYKAEFEKIEVEEKENGLQNKDNVEAISYAAAWITETCLHRRWKNEADQFYEIGKRFAKGPGNLEALARLYNSRAKYLAMIEGLRDEILDFFKLAEDTAKEMPGSERETTNRLLSLITNSREEFEQKSKVGTDESNSQLPCRPRMYFPNKFVPVHANRGKDNRYQDSLQDDGKTE